MEGEKIKKKMKGAEEKENFGVGFLIGRESAEQDKGPEQKVGRLRTAMEKGVSGEKKAPNNKVTLVPGLI